MPDRVRHIITSFDTALNNLKNDVLMMSSLAERLIENAMQGLLKRDSNLCNMTIADDEEVDVLEKQVDKEGIEIMIRFHPVASDMRQVIISDEAWRQPGKSSRSICRRLLDVRKK